MSLLTLPNEILQHIFSLVGPETFEDAALACKRTYDASRPFLKEHNARRRRFRHFRFSDRDDASSGEDEDDAEEGKEKDKSKSQTDDGDEDEIKIGNVLELLQYIAQYPVVTRYMVSADLSHDSLGESSYDAEDAEKPLIKGDASGILRLLQTSPYLKERGYDPSAWLETMKQTLDGHADIFILTLLPNVTSLTISGRMADASYSPSDGQVEDSDSAASPAMQCGSIFEDLVDHANKHPQSEAALSRLRVVANDSLEYDDYDTKNDFTAVASLLSIQSVRQFHGNSFVAMEDGYTGVEFHPRHERLSPSLQEVVLECSILGAVSASKLFNRIENLRVFRLSWAVKYHGCGFNWDTGAMLHSLEQAAGNTLEELTIHDRGDTNMSGTVPVTLTGFKRLRVFESDFMFLYGQPFDRASQGEELEDDAEPSNAAGDGVDGLVDKVAPFVDFLPGTIERILFSVGSWDYLVRQDVFFLFERMHEERATKLPRLKDILFVIPEVGGPGNPIFPVTADMLPDVSEKTKARDRLVALVTNCGGTFKTKDWWQPTLALNSLED